MLDEITYSFINFNGDDVEFYECIDSFFPDVIWQVIT